jgi:prepilin-type N-terminal cleavage/methylation domain-containing protein
VFYFFKKWPIVSPIASLYNRHRPSLWLKNQTGFSLVELLVALALLGTLVAYTIPSVLTAQSVAQEKVINKDTIGTISQTVYNIAQAGFNANAQSPVDLFASKINAVKICKTDIIAEGCSQFNPQIGYAYDAMVLHTGAVVYFHHYSTTPGLDWFFIDNDGVGVESAWNTRGTVLLEYNITQTLAERHSGWSGLIRPGTIQTTMGDYSAVLYWSNLFQ